MIISCSSIFSLVAADFFFYFVYVSFMNPSWVNFYYVKPDLLIKLFEIELNWYIFLFCANKCHYFVITS